MNHTYKKKEPLTTSTFCVRDLRKGVYLNLPVKKFAGNIFLTGNEFFEVMAAGNWRRVKNLEERKKLLEEFGVKHVEEPPNEENNTSDSPVAATLPSV